MDLSLEKELKWCFYGLLLYAKRQKSQDIRGQSISGYSVWKFNTMCCFSKYFTLTGTLGELQQRRGNKTFRKEMQRKDQKMENIEWMPGFFKVFSHFWYVQVQKGTKRGRAAPLWEDRSAFWVSTWLISIWECQGGGEAFPPSKA